MPEPLPMDLRESLFAAYERGDLTGMRSLRSSHEPTLK